MKRLKLFIAEMFILAILAVALVFYVRAGEDGTDTKESLAFVQENDTKEAEDMGTIVLDTEEKTGQTDVEENISRQVEQILSSMTLEEKVGQMFFVTPESLTGVSKVTAAGTTTDTALTNYPVGGIVYFEANLQNPQQTKQMLSHVQEYMTDKSGFPVFLGVDEEGGRVARIGNNTNFGVEKVEAMGTLAKEGDAAKIHQAGKTIGAYLKELGFNVDFAPDADVLTNSDNQVIGSRSFGTDASLVSDMAWEYTKGLHEEGILASYKHFPGHGGTSEDSHSGYAYSHKSLEELKEAELVPFSFGAENGVDFIMVSHISTPEASGNDTPASLSKFWVTDILRNDMGYEGIIITDSLAMGAVSAHYSAMESVELAIEAGCDMVLIPKDFPAVYAGLLEKVKSGEILEKRIEESVSRILKAKMKLMER